MLTGVQPLFCLRGRGGNYPLPNEIVDESNRIDDLALLAQPANHKTDVNDAFSWLLLAVHVRVGLIRPSEFNKRAGTKTGRFHLPLRGYRSEPHLSPLKYNGGPPPNLAISLFHHSRRSHAKPRTLSRFRERRRYSRD